MQSKDIKQWVMIAALGGSGMGGLGHIKNWIEILWQPYKDEQQHTRHEMERVNYNLLVLQQQLTDKTLDEAIETVNEELYD